MVTATLGVSDPELGTVARVGNNDYIFVYNAGNSQISTGFAATVSGVSGYSVTVSSVAALGDIPVGLCVHNTMATATYGWLLKRGFCQFAATANSGTVIGQQLVLGDDGTMGTKTISTGFIGNAWGKVMVSGASGASCSGYFAIP